MRELRIVPYLGPVEQVLKRPNARVLDIATVRSLSDMADDRALGCTF